MKTKLLFSALILSCVILAVLAPNVTSQRFTTVTSLLTSSFGQALTSYSTAYSTVISTGQRSAQATFQFEIGDKCYIQGWGIFNFTGNTHVEYTANGPMTLYILGGRTVINGVNVPWWAV